MRVLSESPGKKANPLMLFRRINATVLLVENLTACTKFYQEILGLEKTFSDEVSIGFKLGDQDFLLLKRSAAAEMVGEEPLRQAGGSRVLLCAGVENVDDTCKVLTDKGIALLKPPKNQPWGRRTAYFADPEGNLWELYHHLDAEQQQ